MLESVDILIGLSVVMLVVSMAVTMMNQAEAIAAKTLSHSIIGGKIWSWLSSWSWLQPWLRALQYGDVIHREEFIKILLNLAASDPTLKKVLKENGIEDPDATLKNVRMLALQYEKSHPKLANDIRQAKALLQEASSEFLAKIHLNFDQVMDRVSMRFTTTTRVVSFCSAALVAIVLQLDMVYVINRLSIDDQMRAAFVELAPKLTANQEVKSITQIPTPAQQSTGNKGEVQANTAAETDKANERAKQETKKYYLKFVADQGLISIATSYSEWRDNWKSLSIPGLILSILLLSLGAPFWYNALGKLLQLRSILAQKDDEQKKIRQTTQPGGTDSQQSQDNPASPD